MQSKYLLIQRVFAHRFLALSILFSLGLIVWRVIYTGHVTYAFLIWNLILAFIPFAISELAIGQNGRLFSLKNVLAIGACVAFLPNAPYIVTDLFHLRWNDSSTIWYDTLVIASCALNGLVLFFHSLINLDEKVFSRFGRWKAWFIKLGIIISSAFGIYLGRYLRFNSWDIISDPSTLVFEIGHRIIHPFQHPLTWSMTLLYGAFLIFTYLSFLGLQRNSVTLKA